MKLRVNGEDREIQDAATIAALLGELRVDARRVAVEVNLSVIPRGRFGETPLRDGDQIEIVQFVGGGAVESSTLSRTATDTNTDRLHVGKYSFRSRLIVGTGKYATLPLMAEALEASGADLVTVAVRRVNLNRGHGESLLDYIDTKKITLLPNTAGCYTADEAVRTAHLGREAGFSDLVKLEVLGDPRTLLPDPVETLDATKRLVKDGFTVLVYTSDDPIIARRLQDAGATSVMPAGSPIGSGQGILNPSAIRIILESAMVPIIVDAGVGTASDVTIAMELGVEGVLLNTGIASAQDPVRMAHAMRHACEAGRLAFLSGRIPRKLYAQASSPIEGVVR
ncbi:MAG: sulfur carrier protein ThiS [Planctomycetes bacterium]|nr:sulfur carrier protein ThiS [Planctomycetota bacterium]